MASNMSLIRSPFVRDFVIITVTTLIVDVIWFVSSAILGTETLPALLYALVRGALGAAIIGCLAATAIRFMGQLACWKDLTACVVSSFVLAMVTGLPIAMGDRLLSSLFLGIFLAAMLAKSRSWLGGGTSKLR